MVSQVYNVESPGSVPLYSNSAVFSTLLLWLSECELQVINSVSFFEEWLVTYFIVSKVRTTYTDTSTLSYAFSSITNESFTTERSVVYYIAAKLPIVSSGYSFIDIPPVRSASAPTFTETTLVLSIAMVVM